MLTIQRKTLKNYYWLQSSQWYEDDYYNGKVFFMRHEKDIPLECENDADQKLKYEFLDTNINIFVFEDANTLRRNLKQ